MAFLSKLIWGVILLGISVAIGIKIMSSMGSSLTGDASSAINSTVSAINTNLVGNYGLIILIAVFAFILMLVALFRRGAGGGGI